MPCPRPPEPLLILSSLNLLDYLDRYLVASLGSLIQSRPALERQGLRVFGDRLFPGIFRKLHPCSATWGTAAAGLRLMAGGAVLWSLATSLTYWVPSYSLPGGGPGLVGGGRAALFRYPGPGLTWRISCPWAPGPGPGPVLPGAAGGLRPGLPGRAPWWAAIGAGGRHSCWRAAGAWPWPGLIYA